MEDLHRKLLAIGFSAGADLGLVLAGGYALTQHGLLDRASRDIDFATATLMPLPDVTARLMSAYRNAGYHVEVIETTTRMARLMVSTPEETCAVDLLKEAIGPPARLRIGPVLAIEDAVGLKVRALHERAAHRDYVDVHAASKLMPLREIEALGAHHTPNFSLAELADRLGNVGELADDGFERYGLSTEDSRTLVRWAVGWESDIRLRLAAGEDDSPRRVVEDDWENYIDPPNP